MQKRAEGENEQGYRHERRDPQVERTRSAVLRAASVLLMEEGPEAVTHQRVARAARVGRATIYRHWPEREDLLIEVLTSLAPPPPAGVVENADRVGPAITEVREAMKAVRSALWGDLGTLFAMLIGRAEWDTRLQPVKQSVIGWTKVSLGAAMERGIERGELNPQLDPELIVSALLGFMLARRFVLEETVSDGDIEDLLDAMLPRLP